jgi:hypothetical protein
VQIFSSGLRGTYTNQQLIQQPKRTRSRSSGGEDGEYSAAQSERKTSSR